MPYTVIIVSEGENTQAFCRAWPTIDAAKRSIEDDITETGYELAQEDDENGYSLAVANQFIATMRAARAPGFLGTFLDTEDYYILEVKV